MVKSGIKKYLVPLFAAAVIIFFISVSSRFVYAQSASDFISNYEVLTYDSYDGLVSEQINAVTQSTDGYIWIGTYSGLYRYDGYRFEEASLDERICNVTALFVSSDGAMWVGTNDSGLYEFYSVNGSMRLYAAYTTDEGFDSDSIRSICEDDDGNIFVGTVGAVSVISIDGSVTTCDDWEDISGIHNLCYAGDNIVCGVTNSGIFFTMDSSSLIDTVICDEEGVYYTCVGSGGEGTILVGASSDTVNVYTEVRGKLLAGKTVEIKDAQYFNTLLYDEDMRSYFYCAENGIGIVDITRSASYNLNVYQFDSSASGVIKDYQGNIWFTSNKQGIIEYCADPFTDIFAGADLGETVVNAVSVHDDILYAGADDGLYMIDMNSGLSVENDIIEMFEGVRIRHIMEDSSGNMWFSTYGKDGLVEIKSDGTVKTYTEEESGTVGGRFRCCLELSDGTVFAASNMGLNIIKNEEVTDTIGEKAGINAQILTMVEEEDGSVLAGSDGDGIYRIKDGEIVERIDKDSGLSTLVILRIIPCDDGYLYVTSNAIYIDDGSKVRRLENFPYTNCYDIYLTDENEAWILSSAGIYLVNYETLIADEEAYSYNLLDYSHGLTTSITANAWIDTKESDTGDMLYLCCTDGVRSIDTGNYIRGDMDYNILVNYLKYEDEEILPDEEGVFVVPKGSGRVEILPAVLDYTMSNSLIHTYIEGLNSLGITSYHEELGVLAYTNMPYGTYTLHVEILDPVDGTALRDVTFEIKKTPTVFELYWVQALIIIAGMLLVALGVWWVIHATIITRQVVEIREARDEAERANSAKSRFLANMSHEIRTPINTIMGMDEMILRESPASSGFASAVKGYAKSIKTAADSLLTQVNDILDLSKIESGKMELVEREYDTAELLKAVCLMIRVRSNEKGLEFMTEITPELPSMLLGDDGKIKQIILNLLTNAVKYTNEGYFKLMVSVTGKSEDAVTVRYAVEDSGIGIRPEDMDKLFSAYQRLDEKKNSGIQGTGLGLDISRQFAELMGGGLHVESIYGEGSKFWFEVRQPIVNPDPIGEFTEEASSDENEEYVPLFEAPDARILVVDDSSVNLTVFKGLLARTKVQIDTAESGAKCLEKLSKNSYHIVFLDHMMPEMDGVETMQRISGMDIETPVYALTANAATSGDDYYISRGFSGYLAKPIDAKILEETLRKVLPDDILHEASEKTDSQSDEESGIIERLSAIDGINTAEGIKNCGGIDGYIATISDFYSSLRSNSDEIEDAYNREDFEFFTIKVHALKSAARVTGMGELSKMAEQMEDEGKTRNIEYIRANTGELLDTYRSFEDALSPVFSDDNENDDRPYADAEYIEDAVNALLEVAEVMDYDSAEMILDDIKGYRLDNKYAELFKTAGRLLKSLDWEGLKDIMYKAQNGE